MDWSMEETMGDGKKVHVIKFNREAEERVTVRRLHLDPKTLDAETVYEKAYDEGELDIQEAYAWCRSHGYPRTPDESELEAMGLIPVQATFVHESVPDRFDLNKLSDGRVRVTLFDRHDGRDVARATYTIQGDVEEIRNTLGDCGFSTYFWETGARAFRGEPWPIRTRVQIWHKRRKLEEQVRQRVLENGDVLCPEDALLSLDLAYAG